MGTVQEQIYRTIRQHLIQGRWRPREKLSEEPLAAELGVNRNPVREALIKLAGEGWLERSPGAGCRVVGVDRQQIGHMMRLREAVEGMAARLAATSADDVQLLRIEQEHDLMRKLAGSRDTDAFTQSDTRFHRLIIEASGNPILLSVWDQYHVRVLSVHGILRQMYEEGGAVWANEDAATIRGHQRIVDALRRHDADAAERAARQATAEGLEGYDRILREYERRQKKGKARFA